MNVWTVPKKGGGCVEVAVSGDLTVCASLY